MIASIVNAMTLFSVVHTSAYTRRQRLFPSTSLTGGIKIGRVKSNVFLLNWFFDGILRVLRENRVPLLRRHKYAVAATLLYWPAIFAATHIPVPMVVRGSGISDKAMHIAAYLVLAALCWLVFSPYEKVRLLKPKLWLVIGLMICYGAVDEWLQSFVNRNPSIIDFGANMLGAVIGLAVLAIFSFWPALLVISAMLIFAVTNLSRAEIIFSNLTINYMFEFLAYGIFTLIWIQFADRKRKLKCSSSKKMMIDLSVPIVLLAIVKLCSIPFDKKIWLLDITLSLAGIVGAVAAAYLWDITGSKDSTGTDDTADHL